MSEPLFKSKPIKIDTLGAYLKQLREKLNLDIKTVSLLTQIKPAYLENLESGNYEKLPADVYIRGFIKNLSQLYRVEEEPLVEQFEKEHGFAKAHSVRAALHPKRAWFTPRMIIILSSVALFLAGFIYVATQVSSVLTPPKLTIDEPAGDETITGNSVVISGNAEIGSDVAINDQAVFLDPNGQFNENVILSDGINIIQITAKNRFNKATTVTRQINAQIPTTAPQTPASPVNLTIVIGPNPAWLSIEADGVTLQRGTMLAGSTKTISANDEIVLTSANAGSTQVLYNGKDLGKLGREGEVIRNVEFNSQTASP
ncbi:MAG TPA: RodZ domain-containing protein [Patescibacteria group bacterium]|nr:RodZ domain-containing protein [Patescibacteria group bacterium]